MARPRFSEMLVDRRRQLGLSVKQASDVLRLKEDVLIAFEEGDFDAMPKSGYAQGMLSSYARYLGINSRELINQFTRDLHDWERQSAAARARARRSARGRGDEPVYELPGDQESRRAGYRGSRGLLPTSGGFAGDLSTYSTVSSPRSRNSRSTQLVNYRQRQANRAAGYTPRQQAGYGRGYQDDGGSYRQEGWGYPSYEGPATEVGYRGPAIEDAYEARRQVPRGSYDSERRYTSRDVAPRGERRRGAQGQGRYLRQADEYGNYARYTGNEGQAERSSRDSVVYQDVPGQYVDDLRYEGARPYEAASTRSGRQSSRNIANPQRPNVRRRQSSRRGRDQRQRAERDRRRRPQHGGLLGLVEAFFSDGRRTIAFAVFAAAIIITVVIIASVSSCVGNQNATPTKSVSVSTSSTKSSSSNDDSSSSSSTAKKEAEAAAAAATAKKTAQEEKDANTVTKVSVSVASGEVSWVEITCDGKSVVAEQITGSWKKTYTVTDSISIQVSNPTAVTVKKNGKIQKFDSKTAGVGSITIQGTKVTSTDSSDSSSSDSTNSTSTTNGTTSSTSDTTSTTSGTTNSTTGTTTGGTSNTGTTSTGTSTSSGTSTNSGATTTTTT
ncbi:MAG: helix-turn-helix domain-containing protein [Parafannyhessea sp.]|uniref:helix-turn-helix domain-containing protein n=1 Tax=Parafannyhessea sp. TaxID=2847324 RepID=UPI003EFD24D8